MRDWSIPVERLEHDGVDTGVIRCNGQPDLEAHQPEAWRFLRLARIVGAARAIASDEISASEADRLIAAMASIQDCKGDFSVVWRFADERFEKIVERALAIEGEIEIIHFVGAEPR